VATAIELEGVTFGYTDTPAVEDISLTIDKGEFFGLVGPNGSGKTTLLKLILGVHDPDAGDITVFGEPIEAFNAGSRIGYVPQQSSRKGDTMPVTVREVVAMGRFPHSPFTRFDETDVVLVEDAMETVGISELSDRRISRLSGGQKQRVFIARALASNADLLALDEPTVGIDAASRDEFFTLLSELNRDGITTILIEHDLNTVATYADRIACINRSVHYVGSAADFIASDGHVDRRPDSDVRPLYADGTAGYTDPVQNSPDT